MVDPLQLLAVEPQLSPVHPQEIGGLHVDYVDLGELSGHEILHQIPVPVNHLDRLLQPLLTVFVGRLAGAVAQNVALGVGIGFL